MVRGNKYGAKKTYVAEIGRWFDSKAEALRAVVLWQMQKDGDISGLEFQIKYPLVVNDVKIGSWSADFRYVDKAGQTIVEDVKGYRTQQYALRKKLMKAIHGVTITEIAA